MDWDRLRVFRVVAEAKSFTQAGEVLNLSQSAVSRQISALETSLNTALFHRHARGLVLTEQGEILDQAAREVFAKLSAVETLVRESKEKPSGVLRITTTVAFGSIWLAPRMGEFADAYPEIETHLILRDEELDLGMRDADVAIRMYAPRQPDLISRLLFEIRTQVYAAPAYVEQHGAPQTVGDLARHRLIIYGDDARPPVPGGSWPVSFSARSSGPIEEPPVPRVNWLAEISAESGAPPAQMLVLNNIYGIAQAVRAGGGVAALPSYVAADAPELVRVLPELDGPQVSAHFVYAEELRNSQRISAFRDFLLRKVAEGHHG